MNETKRDYYDILGLAKNASQTEIKKAFRKLALKYHPDKTKGDTTAEKKFKEINEAYSILSDPKKKATYDQFGHQAEHFQNFQGGGFNFADSGFHFQSNGFNFNDIFSDIFGSDVFSGTRGRRHTPLKGQDLHHTLEISFEEAFNGSSRILSFHPPKDAGVNEIKKIEVKIPKGIKDGQQLKIEGQGAPGSHGAPNGDLFVRIHVAPHSIFTREGNDIVSTVKIPFYDAILGSTVLVQTLSGNIEMKIPPLTQSGKVFRLKGKGFPISSFTKGSHLVKIQVDLPEKMSSKEKELIQQFKELSVK